MRAYTVSRYVVKPYSHVLLIVHRNIIFLTFSLIVLRENYVWSYGYQIFLYTGHVGETELYLKNWREKCIHTCQYGLTFIHPPWAVTTTYNKYRSISFPLIFGFFLNGVLKRVKFTICVKKTNDIIEKCDIYRVQK